jgi:phytoene synthase
MDLIAGVRSDLEPVRIPDIDALLRYCYQVAGTVGLMMCKVLETDSRLAFKHAVDLGIAMQITNICRDVADDAAVDRRYLPTSMVGDVLPTELLKPSTALRSKVVLCVKNLLELAQTYYRSGEQGLSFLPIRARCSILIASRVYGSIGTKLKEREFDCWSGRVVVESERKAWITSQALLGIPVSPSFWKRSTFHNEALHAALLNSPHAISPSYFRHAR